MSRNTNSGQQTFAKYIGVMFLFGGMLSIAQAADQPNIVFIMTDDHARHAISAYGSKVNKTPNIDRIAKEGMLFNNCFVTNSICGPCRAVILTGKYNHINGFFRNGITFNGEQQTFPKLLQKNGYQTAVIGKWHLGSAPTGFDYYNVLKGQGPYYNPPMLTKEGTTKHIGYTTEIITEFALDYLKNKREKGKPFFLMYQHKAPHRNWQPGPKYLTMYDDVTITEPETLFDDYSNRASPAANQAMTIARHFSQSDAKLVAPKNLTPEQAAAWNKAYGPKNEAFNKANLEGDAKTKWFYQRYMKDYLRCIAAVDDGIGEVLDYLDKEGLSKNTIVIYTSDQGFYLGDHGWYDKRWMYEESLSTPFIVKYPGHIKPGVKNNDIVLNLDFAETFLDYAGVEIPTDMQGKSLRPVLEGATPADWRKSMYYHYYEFPGPHSVARHYGIRNERYKLIHYYQVKEWEFFDLKTDPNELKSTYDDPASKELITQMKKELADYRVQYKVPDVDPVVMRKPQKKKPAPKKEVAANKTTTG